MTWSSSRRTFLVSGLAAAGPAALPSTPPPVRHRVLGKTGLKVSELAFGSEAVSDISVFARALDLGITFFDTARPYEGGNAEHILGKALGARRRNVVLTSRSYGKDRRSILADLDTSLQALGTDYLDVWYIGNKDKPADVSPDMMEAQESARKQGKIRFRGLSTHRIHEWRPLLKDQRHFDVVLTPYNFASGSPRDFFDYPVRNLDENLQALAAAGFGVVAIKVMAGGYRKHTPGDKLFGVFQKPQAHVAALRWALRHPYVHAAAVRMVDRDQLEENFRAMSAPFSDNDGRILAAHLEHIRPLVCRMCGDCDGTCPRGLPVSDLVRFAMYADGYRNFQMGYERFRQLPEELKAVRCGDCGVCPVRCPNGVAVRERATRAQELFG